jgi:hypothetical protein
MTTCGPHAGARAIQGAQRSFMLTRIGKYKLKNV